MISLDDEYKIAVAKELTSLAIENNMISKYSDSDHTAKEVTKFFRTIFETLDSTT